MVLEFSSGDISELFQKNVCRFWSLYVIYLKPKTEPYLPETY